MFDEQFLQSKVGAAAMVSIAAMVSFNLAALSYQLDHRPAHHLAAVLQPLELA